MKKYITILYWSKFFVYFIILCCINALMGTLILADCSLAFYFLITVTYALFILFIPAYYERFYNLQNGMRALMVIPVPVKQLTKLLKSSMYCMMFIPAVILTCMLLIQHSSLGFVILPDHVLAAAVYHFIKKQNDEENFMSLLFLLGTLPFTILFLIEIGLFTGI